MDNIRYESIIEGLLFMVGEEGIDLRQLSSVLKLLPSDVEPIIVHMQKTYQENKRGILIDFIGGRYKFVTNPIFYDYFQSLIQYVPTTLSNAAIETLAIIAYQQPVTRAEIEDIRGVGCDAIIRRLLSKNLIKELGRDETKPGKPQKFGVTHTFMDYFKLASLEELPDIKKVETSETEDLFSTRYQEK